MGSAVSRVNKQSTALVCLVRSCPKFLAGCLRVLGHSGLPHPFHVCKTGNYNQPPPCTGQKFSTVRATVRGGPFLVKNPQQGIV